MMTREEFALIAEFVKQRSPADGAFCLDSIALTRIILNIKRDAAVRRAGIDLADVRAGIWREPYDVSLHVMQHSASDLTALQNQFCPHFVEVPSSLESEDNLFEVWRWVYANIKGYFYERPIIGMWGFEHLEYAILFKLRWVGSSS